MMVENIIKYDGKTKYGFSLINVCFIILWVLLFHIYVNLIMK